MLGLLITRKQWEEKIIQSEFQFGENFSEWLDRGQERPDEPFCPTATASHICLKLCSASLALDSCSFIYWLGVGDGLTLQIPFVNKLYLVSVTHCWVFGNGLMLMNWCFRC